MPGKQPVGGSKDQKGQNDEDNRIDYQAKIGRKGARAGAAAFTLPVKVILSLDLRSAGRPPRINL